MSKPRKLDPAAIVGALTTEQMSVLASVDRSGRPHLSVVSWLRGRPPGAVEILVGRTARLLKNLDYHQDVTLMVFLDTAYAVEGRARVVVETVPDMPIPLSLIRLEVDAVFDGMFTGGQLVSGPQYVKDYPEKLAHLDQLVDHYLDAAAAAAPAVGPAGQHP
jgi:hypothetical protein